MNSRMGLVNETRPIADCEQQISPKDEIKAVLFPSPILLNIVEFKRAVWWNPCKSLLARISRPIRVAVPTN